MSHRSSNAFHQASALDLGVLTLGVVLAVTGIGLAASASFADLPGTVPGINACWTSGGGEQ
jgi:hypothetical protein